MPSKLSLLSIALLALAAPLSHADDTGLEFNGFLNVVGGILKEAPVIDFSDKKQVPNYQGYEDNLVFDPHSSAGLQAKKQLDEKTAVTLQLYAEGDNDQYKATMKWLYVTYEPSYNSTLRVGKLAAPIYYYSDYLNVGYAYHWITPPESVYPFDTSMNGISYVYQNSWGRFDWSTELILGSGDDYFPIIGARVITRKSRGIGFNVSTNEWLSLRAMVFRTNGTFEVDALADEPLGESIGIATDAALEEAGLPADIAAAVRSDLITATRAKLDNGALDLEDFGITYGDLALRAETERWFLMTEAITVRTDTYLYNDLVSAFVTGGVRSGDALFHITFTRGRANPHDSVYADRANAEPADLTTDAVADVLASKIRTTLAGAVYRHLESVSVGVRLETSTNTAVKFEITDFEELESFEGDETGVGKNTLFRAALNATF